MISPTLLQSFSSQPKPSDRIPILRAEAEDAVLKEDYDTAYQKLSALVTELFNQVASPTDVAAALLDLGSIAAHRKHPGEPMRARQEAEQMFWRAHQVLEEHGLIEGRQDVFLHLAGLMRRWDREGLHFVASAYRAYHYSLRCQDMQTCGDALNLLTQAFERVRRKEAVEAAFTVLDSNSSIDEAMVRKVASAAATIRNHAEECLKSLSDRSRAGTNQPKSAAPRKTPRYRNRRLRKSRYPTASTTV